MTLKFLSDNRECPQSNFDYNSEISLKQTGETSKQKQSTSWFEFLFWRHSRLVLGSRLSPVMDQPLVNFYEA